MNNKDTVDNLRKAMGTMPDQKPTRTTPFYIGVDSIGARLIDGPINPYKAIFTMTTSTWGKKIDKWHEVSQEGRIEVVKAALSHKTLPTALEAPSFTFAIEGLSRSAFDQIARARIGAGFASMGWRDNSHEDIGFRIPQDIADGDEETLLHFKESCLKAKEVYSEIINKGQGSWQDARAVLPISAIHRFSMCINYLALQSFCAKRLKFCEQADTVMTAWFMKEAVRDKYPLLGVYLKPGCDIVGRCQYADEYSMSEIFGCLFAPCGRNPVKNPVDYSEFNKSCTDVSKIEELLGYSTIEVQSYIDDAVEAEIERGNFD